MARRVGAMEFCRWTVDRGSVRGIDESDPGPRTDQASPVFSTLMLRSKNFVWFNYSGEIIDSGSD